MTWPKFQLPDSPPPLTERVTLSRKQTEKAEELLSDLAVALETFPVVLCQQGEVVCYAGTPDEKIAERIARLADRVWREGATRVAREVIRFNEEVIDEQTERTSFMLYSAHVSGALTLAVGWRLTLSLTQLRAEVGDTIQELKQVLRV